MSPRPNQPRTIGAEDAMRRNIQRWLEANDRSVAWLERKAEMPAGALHKSLHQGRQIYVEELISLALATGMTASALTRNGEGK